VLYSPYFLLKEALDATGTQLQTLSDAFIAIWYIAIIQCPASVWQPQLPCTGANTPSFRCDLFQRHRLTPSKRYNHKEASSPVLRWIIPRCSLTQGPEYAHDEFS
jgi:hypothetical protein